MREVGLPVIVVLEQEDVWFPIHLVDCESRRAPRLILHGVDPVDERLLLRHDSSLSIHQLHAASQQLVLAATPPYGIRDGARRE